MSEYSDEKVITVEEVTTKKTKKKSRKTKKAVLRIIALVMSGILAISTTLVLALSEPSNLNKSEYKDADGDGLYDWIEEMVGTDKNKKDTDEDGLDDYTEVIILSTDPLLADSDGDGILDKDLDGDEDGLTNAEEVLAGSDPALFDTDDDGLTDYEEVKIYLTNPALADSDGDGLNDCTEIRLRLDPLNPKTDGETLDSEVVLEQTITASSISEELLEAENAAKPSVSADIAGDIDDYIELVPADEMALNDNRAIVGTPVIFRETYDGSAKWELSFEIYDLVEAYGKAYGDGLLICRYTDDGEIEPLESNYNNSMRSVEAEIEEDGTYFLIDAEKFLRYIGVTMVGDTAPDDETDIDDETEVDDETVYDDETDVDDDTLLEEGETPAYDVSPDAIGVSPAPTPDSTITVPVIAGTMVSGQADIVFAIDTTGSMGDEIINVAENIEDFVTRLTDEYRVSVNFALVEYKDIIEDYLESTVVVKSYFSNWFTDAESFKNAVASLGVAGGGDDYETAIDALEVARRLDFRSTSQKFIILVTDNGFKVDNNYGISNMSEMVELLNENDISASVVAPSGYKETYRELFTNTDGIFANIYGDFSYELLTLADKIGEETSKGHWVMLDDFTVVRLDGEELDEGTDTDGDGLSDIEELGSKKRIEITAFIKAALKAQGIEDAEITGDTYIEIYDYTSNPALPDTDFDGIDDGEDSKPKNNKFSGTMKGHETIDVNYSMNYSKFFGNNATYNSTLSTMSLLLASSIYDGTTLDGKSTEDILSYHGMSHTVTYKLKEDGKYTDDHISEIVIGIRKVLYNGIEKEVIGIVVRGTNGTIEEWTSNFDVGTTKNFGSITGWATEANHMGFDITTNRILDYVHTYVATNGDASIADAYWITGHSRGAAIANILGAYLSDEGKEVFDYTFAAPYTTTAWNASSYNGIFNVVNQDDFVPCLPMTAWGFTRYGKTASISVENKYKSEWKKLTGEKYNCDKYGMQKTVDALAAIAEDRDDLYEYTCYCHGNGEDDTITNTFSTLKKRNAHKAIVPKNALDYCVFDVRSKTTLLGGSADEYTMCQTPAYLMQLLAAFMAGKIEETTFGIDLNIAKRYENAKAQLVFSSVGGLEHPHYPETYYLISQHATGSNFA